jgi:hypothetical protein
MEDQILERYAVRPTENGFRVIDVWTGQTVVMGQTAQTDMSGEDAAHTAKMLNHRGLVGEPKVCD